MLARTGWCVRGNQLTHEKILFALLSLCFVAPCYGGPRQSKWDERADWSLYFKAARVDGCFLLYDLQQDQYFSYNRKRANTGYLPASTYKILNSMQIVDLLLDSGADPNLAGADWATPLEWAKKK